MDFTKLPSNPNSKHRFENPSLLSNMEQHQFVHSRNSSFNVIPPRLQSLRQNRKPKRNFKSPSISFFQSSKFQAPNNSNPRPRKPYWPKVYTRKYNPLPIPRTNPDPPSYPKLINPSDSKKYLEMTKNIQPGMNTQVHRAVADVVKAARWDGLVSHLSKRYCINRMGEFYLKIRITKGLNGVLHFTTVVDKKTILIDHKTINKALHLPAVLTDR